MRDIRPGEDITYDYAMSDGSAYDEFDCACGAAECRGFISGNDWQKPDLWLKYNGFFSPYLDRRIQWLRKQLAARKKVGRGAVNRNAIIAAE
jgi:hypothetical protein